MKTKIILGLSLLFAFGTALGQGTAFTYQGRLNNGAAPANGSYDLQFILFNTNQFGFPASPMVTNTAVMVNNGLFTTTLDFGSGIFTGTNFWLDIGVRTNGGGAFAELSPRQPLTPVPYAVTAENIASVVENNILNGGGGTVGGGNNNTVSNFNATVSGGANNTASGNASDVGGGSENGVTGDHAVIGGGQSNTNDGNHATIAGGFKNYIGGETNIGLSVLYSFIGGGDNNTNLSSDTFIGGGEFNVIDIFSAYAAITGGRGNLIQPSAPWSMIGGGFGNTIQLGADDATIGGGNGNTISAFESFIGGGQANFIHASATWSTIGGGLNNVIQTNASYSFIGGGNGNTIQSNSQNAFIGGGTANTIQTNAFYSTIGGGVLNVIQTGTESATIGGGQANIIQTNSQFGAIAGGWQNLILFNSFYASIGGGFENTIQTNVAGAVIGGGVGNTIQANATGAVIAGGSGNTNSGIYSTIPGGIENLAVGNYSFAAGQGAEALHQGAFVWADSLGSSFSSTANNQFLIRAAGGVGINTNNPNGTSLSVVGNRTGVAPNAFMNPVAVFENTSTAVGSSPALRVIVDGGDSPSGALTVSANGTGNIAQFGNRTAFVVTITNDGTLICKTLIQTSDRNAKENFTTLDAKTVLAKVAAMPVTEWNYKDDSSDKKHIGPMAQDFLAAFGLNGKDDKHISVGDEGGVALAAIQGLNQKVEDGGQKSEVRMQKLEMENAELRERLEKLERLLITRGEPSPLRSAQ